MTIARGRPLSHANHKHHLLASVKAAVRQYSHVEHQDYMFHHNTQTRTFYYEHDVAEPSIGLDHCYDCASEALILKQYLRRCCGLSDKAEIKAAVLVLSAQLSRICSGSGRSLAL